MKKYQCIYKYTKGAQSTETDETDSDSDTERQHGQSNIFFFSFFFFDWGYMCGHQNQKDMASYPSPLAVLLMKITLLWANTSRKSKQAQLIFQLDWGYMWGRHTQR